MNHSIADSVAFAIHTRMGTIVHTGDFKIDSTPIDGEVIDLARISSPCEPVVTMTCWFRGSPFSRLMSTSVFFGTPARRS